MDNKVKDTRRPTNDITSLVKTIVSRHQGECHEDAIIPILNDVQETLGCIPYEAQRCIAIETGMSLADIYGIVTFYSRFSLNAKGDYRISICMGTACYVKGSQKILDRIEQYCGIRAGETTKDGLYSIDTTRCVGNCGLAPIIQVNDDIFGHVDPDDVETILDAYKAEL
jgi:NADH:ubiquinone oxidoreductase subunit E